MFFTAGELQAVAIVLILIAYEIMKYHVLAIGSSIMRHGPETLQEGAVEEPTERRKGNHDTDRERRQTSFRGKSIVHEGSEATARKGSWKEYVF